MNKCTILFIEDDKEHLQATKEGLEEIGHDVIPFRDVATLETADKNGDIKDPDLAIVDIMLAWRLDHSLDFAPRWTKDEPIPEREKDSYVDNKLGLDLAHRIRGGEFDHIDKDIPILFLTARQNKELIKEIDAMKNANYLDKPVFVEDIQKTIEIIMYQQKKDVRE